ncbi:glycosylhydrolase-like jelly roll fold domain-containing protein [Alteribacillus sp. HJP-4]|uniref:glycosylhydrolase-like jelly roll fold domain-containing protein n=1 Tax=Alteribacillus sp. HJP-4 TaxID=2775394 RepID=UPI0035CCFC40
MLSQLKKQFLHPSDEYTPVPFWFWNDDLSEKELCRQIHDFYEKGVNGFVLHPRIGMPESIEYLSNAFMKFVRTAVAEAASLGMQVFLYDEGMYPSGSASGQVVKADRSYASRGLKMLEYPCAEYQEVNLSFPEHENLISAQAVCKETSTSVEPETGILLSLQDDKITFTPADDREWSILLFVETYTEGTIRGIHEGEDDGEEHAPASADLLNPDAVNKFIELTHERYYSELKQYFGNTIIAVFTDEPDILGRNARPDLKPWTSGFLGWYKKQGNKESDLPYLWFHAENKADYVRSEFNKAVNDKLRLSYYQPISKWCAAHGIALTGHPAASDEIGMLANFHIPGQDVVWRWVAPEEGKALEGEHSTAGKCSSDAARHRGRRRNMNEFLGVCGKESGWALSPGDKKWYIDWLAVRGINLFCPHAFYYSVKGSIRSHERPPDVGPNNTWWPYYHHFSTYMKRLSWLMTDSINQTKIAVLCREDFLPWKVTKPLYENQIEFNYLEESLLHESSWKEKSISIQKQKYSVILVEDKAMFDMRTIEILDEFTAQGGSVILMEQLGRFIERAEKKLSIIPASRSIRLSSVVKDGCTFYLMVNEGEEAYQGKVEFGKTPGRIEQWDAWSGKAAEVRTEPAPLRLQRRESVIFAVEPGGEITGEELESQNLQIDSIHFNDSWHIQLPDGTKNLQPLRSWTEWSGYDHFSGTMTYEQSIELEEVSNITSAELELGVIGDIAEVFVNGKNAGLRMWAPYRIWIRENVLQQGVNHFRIKVTNSSANEKDHAGLQSGLIGPVRLDIHYYK